MSIFFLRIVLAIEALIAAVAIHDGYDYLSWQDVPLSEVSSSRDAIFSIENLHSSWWFFKGICLGMTIFMALFAIVHRKNIIDGTWKLKAHWVALIIPMLVVFWYGRNIGYGA